MERREYITESRTGEPPGYGDSSNPKAYRRELIEWIKCQEMTDEDSSKYLSLGQRILAIIRKIFGSTKLRLYFITDMVHANMTDEEYAERVDHILDTIDLVDRESSFLETDKTWKELMAKGHGTNQTYDQYWMEYSSLCNKYVYTHGQVALSPGVQELIGLLCVINAHLDRSEFGTILQSAIEQQSKINDKASNTPSAVMRSTKPGPRFARDAVSAMSAEPMVEVQLLEGNIRSLTEYKAEVRKLLQELDFALNKCNTIENAITNAVESLEGENSTISDAVEALKNVTTRMKSLREGVKEGTDIADKVAKVDLSVFENRFNGETQQNTDEHDPIINMDSVRIVLRRLEFGNRALSNGQQSGNNSRG